MRRFSFEVIDINELVIVIGVIVLAIFSDMKELKIAVASGLVGYLTKNLKNHIQNMNKGG